VEAWGEVFPQRSLIRHHHSSRPNRPLDILALPAHQDAFPVNQPAVFPSAHQSRLSDSRLSDEFFQ
jgi:hypothetical protein